MIKRIDRILSEQTNYSRKEIKKMISMGIVYANEKIINKCDNKYDEDNVIIKISNEEIEIKKHIYLILNKPKGFVSTTDVVKENSVLNLVPDKYRKRKLFPVGRLDKDTTGLMIITDDGEFAHNILAPNKHIEKGYEVTIDIPISKKMISDFKTGLVLKDERCKPAKLTIRSKYLAEVILTEGKYHQIKRMFGAFNAKVIELNRISMGNLVLPSDLKIGNIREATQSELDKIQCKL